MSRQVVRDSITERSIRALGPRTKYFEHHLNKITLLGLLCNKQLSTTNVSKY